MGAKVVYLLVSPEKKTEADNLKAVVATRMPKTLIEVVDLPNAYDFEVIMETLFGVIDKIDQTPVDGEVVLNATGGTKLMMLAAVQVFSGLDRGKIIYLNENTGEIQILTATSSKRMAGDSEQRVTRIPIPIQLKDYFTAHGFDVTFDKEPRPKVSESLFQELIAHQQKHANGVAALNAVAQKAQNNRYFSAVLDQAPTSELRFLLNLFSDEKLLQFSGNTVTFSNEAARFFTNGGWFEDYVCRIIRSLGDVRYCEENIRIVPAGEALGKGNDNELDVCFMYRNTIYLVECKTCRMDETQVTTPIIDKLNTVKQRMGKKTQAIIVSYQNVNPNAQKRANDLNISILAGNRICQLKKYLQEILAPQTGAAS